ncbi:addiction module protein [Candidatus Parabeggiatoa sp. HSG14]|uniref:addiction module protein n=1 Tax=Candidatus Parabeggiatoa sp. HSG14 TaxID=3055593 RepID=UPI0025A72392|nr:addiction module protein [Thiotrichales bacterium HSG14]
MTYELILDEISQLTIAQRILLLEEAWDRIFQSNEEIEIPRWQREELDKRLAEHKTHPNDATNANEFHATLRKSL